MEHLATLREQQAPGGNEDEGTPTFDPKMIDVEQLNQSLGPMFV